VALVIAAMQGALGGLAFTLVGISSPLFWAVLIAFFSLVPVVGSALIWVPAAIWIGLNGHWGKAVVIVAICGGVAGVADNIVRRCCCGMHAADELLLFVSVLGGIEVFGLLGIVAGPTIMAQRWACSVFIWNIATNWKKRGRKALQEYRERNYRPGIQAC